MKRLLFAVTLSLAAATLAGCPKTVEKTTPAKAEVETDPAKQKDPELFRSAMLSKDPNVRARLLGILVARQEDPDAKEYVMRQLVMTWAELGDIEKMEKGAADLSIDDDYPGAQVKNAMAYCYAEKGVKLDVARANILSALNTLDKAETTGAGLPQGLEEQNIPAFVEENRGYFLDTLGWIEHKSGKDKEAVAVLEEAARRTDHGTIRWHLGEAYRANGDVVNAAKSYALSAADDDEDSPKARAALEQLVKEGKAPDGATLLANAKTAHDARIAKEKADQAAEEKKNADAVAAAAAHQRENAKRGALDYRMDASAPDFSIEDFEGKKLVNADLEHQVTVLDFWASWCGPCKMEMPHIQTLKDKYAGKVRFLAVSEDETKDDALDYLKDERLSIPAAFDNGSMGRSFQITGLPTLLVIGPCGKINWVHRGFNPNIESILTQQIDKLISEQGQKCTASVAPAP